MNYLIKTQRLQMREFTSDDAPFFLSLQLDPDYLRYVPDRGIRTLDKAQAFLEQRIIPSYEENGFGLYLVSKRKDDTPVGITGLIKREELEYADIGYGFSSKYFRRGYASETTQAVMDYAYNSLSLGPVVAIVHMENLASIRVLEKLGLHYDGQIELTKGDRTGYYVPQELLGKREQSP